MVKKLLVMKEENLFKTKNDFCLEMEYDYFF